LEAVDPALLEDAVTKATTRRDGQQMTASVVRRRRNTIRAVFSSAVRRGVLETNPFDRVELKRPQRRQEVDVSTVPSVVELMHLVDRVSELRTGGARYGAFFATIGLAGLRPSEAAGLRIDDVELPEQGWGMARLRGATTSPGHRYTTDGSVLEEKGLKHRAVDAVREVPIAPPLVEMLRSYLDRYPPIEGRVFSNVEGRPVTAHNYGKVWRRIRDELWPPGHPCSTAVTYDLRHTAATVMLQAGVSPPEAARRLGHSVDMLMRVYASVFTDERERSNARIDRVLGTASAGHTSPSSR
jgi:integrase